MAIFAAVKKYLLFILLLLPFCEGFAGAANSTVQKRTNVLALEQNLPSALSVSYPHTEFETGCSTVSVSSHGRQQNLQSFFTTAEKAQDFFLKKFITADEELSQVSCSQYLFHMYPSNNFW